MFRQDANPTSFRALQPAVMTVWFQRLNIAMVLHTRSLRDARRR
jgi:hypothetical protein